MCVPMRRGDGSKRGFPFMICPSPIVLYVQKLFNKIQHYMYIPLSKVGIRRKFFNWGISIRHSQLTCLILKDECFFTEIRNKTERFFLTIPFQYCTRGSYQCNMTRKSSKQHTDWKGRNKTVSSHRRHNCQEHILISVSICSLQVVRHAIDFCKLTLCPATLLNVLVSSACILIFYLGFSTQPYF